MASPSALYARDRGWSDRYLDEVRRIVGPFLLKPAPFEVDTQQAGDLVLMTSADLRIAVRVRRSSSSERFPDQITIRSRRDNGAATELEKIISGLGDWFFYGHAVPSNPRLVRWFLLDLDTFRAACAASRARRLAGRSPLFKAGSVNNGDGTSFAWFDVPSIEARFPGFVIASSEGRQA